MKVLQSNRPGRITSIDGSRVFVTAIDNQHYYSFECTNPEILHVEQLITFDFGYIGTSQGITNIKRVSAK